MKCLSAQVFLTLVGLTVCLQSHALASDLLGCGMLDGYLVHNVTKTDEGFELNAAFPVYKKMPTDEVLEESKKAWAEWDGTGEQPKDPRTYSVAVPIASQNLMSFDVEAMAKQRDLFEVLFPSQDINGDIDFEKTKTNVVFDKSECAFLEDEDLMSLLCVRKRPIEMNGVKLKGIRAHMILSWVRELAFGEQPGTFIRSAKPGVRAEIVYYGSKESARSVFDYVPNGRDVHCDYRGKKLLPEELLVIN